MRAPTLWTNYGALCTRKATALALTLSIALGCSTPDEEPEPQPVDPAPPPIAECSVADKNDYVFRLMKDAYLWYSKVPDVDHAAYPSPDDLLEDLMYSPIDRWSYIATKAENDAYYEEGKRVGLGFRMKYETEDSMRLALVYDGSPAAEAGLVRGDRILALNGKTIAEIDEGDLWETILGEDIEGVEVDLSLEDQNGTVKDLTLTKRSFKIVTTIAHTIFQAGDRTVGYLLFDRFLSTSDYELATVFTELKEGGVNELILDLRYNGGGLIDVAQRLGGLIGGVNVNDKVFNTLVHNDRHQDYDKDQLFLPQEHSLDLTRVFVIATGATASASELLINGLRPFVDVKLIGAQTYGKPVGMGAWTHCDIVIHPISFRMLNAKGEGDFYMGFPPDCAADDVLTAPIGGEGDLAFTEALHLLEHGACSASPLKIGTEAAPADRRSKEIRLKGFRREVGVL